MHSLNNIQPTNILNVMKITQNLKLTRDVLYAHSAIYYRHHIGRGDRVRLGAGRK